MLIIIVLSILAAGIFFIALVSIIINTILFIVTKLAVFKILLIISVISIILVTICNFIFFAGVVNRYNKEHNRIIYAKSGKIAYWGIKYNKEYSHFETDMSYFEMDGIKFFNFNKDTLYVKLGEEKCGDPVANIKNNPSTITFFDKIWTFWSTGTTYNKHCIWTLYHVITDNGFEYYFINGFGNFMAEDKLKFIKGSE